MAARCRGLLGLGAEGTGQTGGTGTAEGSGAAGPGTAEELAASLLKGGKKRRVQWLFDTAFLPVKKKDGSQASEELLAALLVGCQECSGENPAQALALLKDELEPCSLEAFACQVWDRWMEQGAPAKQKWILSFVSDVYKRQGEEGLLFARPGFNVIGTANTRDKGVNEMSSALKRRFNFEECPGQGGARGCGL